MLTIFVVSENRVASPVFGETAERMVCSALVQFETGETGDAFAGKLGSVPSFEGRW